VTRSPSETTRPAGSARGPRRAWLPALAPAAGAVSLLVCAWLSVGRKLFWTDEWLTWYLVADGSFAHMLQACGERINAAPPLYFVLGWLWARAFGAGELSLRLFTSAGFAAALLLLVPMLRRAFGRWPAAVAALVTVLGCRELQEHNAEARFYGLYFLEISAALAVLAALARRPRPTRGLLALGALVHAALVTTHYFGFVYSAALLAATVVCLADRPRAAALAAGSIAAGWLAFLPWIPAFRRHLDFGGGRFWVPRPTLAHLLGAFDLVQAAGLAVIAVGLAAFVVEAAGARGTAPIAPEPRPDAHAAATRRALALAALAFALVVPATWVASRRGTSLFLTRYLFPSVIAFTVLLAHVVTRLLERARHADESLGRAASLALRVLPKTILAALAALYVVLPPALVAAQPPAARDVDGLQAPSRLPIVMEDIHDFFVNFRYSRFPESYVYLLDPAFAGSGREAARGANAYQIMEALSRLYPSVPAVPMDEFLARHDRFLVFDSPEMRWFDERIRADPRFECRVPGDDPRWFLVTRRRGG
jgi:hypothetical protein